MSINRECLVREIERALTAAASSRDASQKCDQLKLELREAPDRVGRPRLVATAKEARNRALRVVDDPVPKAEPARRTLVQVIERDVESAITAKERELVRQRMADLRGSCSDVLGYSDVHRVDRIHFPRSPEVRTPYTDQKQAEATVQRGYRATDPDESIDLNADIRQLAELVAIDKCSRADGIGAGTLREFRD